MEMGCNVAGKEGHSGGRCAHPEKPAACLPQLQCSWCPKIGLLLGGAGWRALAGKLCCACPGSGQTVMQLLQMRPSSQQSAGSTTRGSSARQGAAQHAAAISRGGTQIVQNFECFCLQAGGAGGRAQRLLQWTHQQRQGARRAGAAPSGPAARPARSGCPSLFAGYHHHQFCGWLAIKQVCMPRVPEVTKGAKQVLAVHKRRSQLLTHTRTQQLTMVRINY